MGKGQRTWTAKERDHLRALCAAGVTRAEAARRLGRSYWSVMRACRTFGCPLRGFVDRAAVARLNRAGLSDAEIARRLGHHRTNVRDVRVATAGPSRPHGSVRTFRANHDGLTPPEVRTERLSVALAREGWPPGVNGGTARVLAAVEQGARTAADMCRLAECCPKVAWRGIARAAASGWLVRVGGTGFRGSPYTWRLAESVAERRRLAVARKAV